MVVFYIFNTNSYQKGAKFRNSPIKGATYYINSYQKGAKFQNSPIKGVNCSKNSYQKGVKFQNSPIKGVNHIFRKIKIYPMVLTKGYIFNYYLVSFLEWCLSTFAPRTLIVIKIPPMKFPINVGIKLI